MNPKKTWLYLLPLLVFVVLGALLLNSLGKDPQLLPSAKLGKPLPNFKLPVLGKEGSFISAGQLKGQVFMLNVWATWCPSCRIEHPVLNQLAAEGVIIYGLNYKDTPDDALNYLQTLGNPYKKVISDTRGDLGLDLGVYGAPETYLVDANGIIIYRHVGVVTQENWLSTLKPLLEQSRRTGTDERGKK